MSIVNESDLKIYEEDKNFINYENKKALFRTKSSYLMRHNGEIVNVLGVLKGKDKIHDSYIVRFNDDTVENNIMDIELEFNYIRDNVQEECRKKLSKIMKSYNLNNIEAEELLNATYNYDFEINDGVIFNTIESIENLFMDENSEKKINPTNNQLKAMAEYIKETKDYYIINNYDKYTKEIINLILNNEENITLLDFLNEINDMLKHNIVCYSNDMSLSKAKSGFEKEFEIENKKLILINKLIEKEKEKSKEQDIDYVRFCLGYDFLNDMFKKSEVPECDLTYKMCDILAKDFIKSEDYKDERKSLYTNLQNWVKENENLIIKKFKNYNNIDEKSINNSARNSKSEKNNGKER